MTKPKDQTAKFWKHKYDFAEINHLNYRIVLKQYFKLNIKTITTLAMLFALELIFVIISKFIMGSLLIFGTFAIEISFFPILFIMVISNAIYSCVLAALAIWFRILLGSEIIGLISMTITDLSFIVVFAISFFLLKRYILFQLSYKSNLLYCLLMGVAVVIGAIISGLLALLCNQTFIFNLYGVPVTPQLLWIGFGVTIGKFLLNFVIFISVWNQFKTLVEYSRT